MKIFITQISCNYQSEFSRVQSSEWRYNNHSEKRQHGMTLDTFTEPNWSLIESSLELLRSENGSIQLSTNRKISISIERDASKQYLVVVDAGPNPMVIIDKDVRISSEMTGMFGGECLKHNTIDNLDVIAEMLKRYIMHGEFINSEPYVWIDLNSNDDRF